MINYLSILSILFEKVTNPVIQETLNFFELEAECSGFNKSVREPLLELISSSDYQDDCNITISVDSVPFTFNSTKIDNELFFSNYSKYQSSESIDDQIKVNINFNKKIHDSQLINLYSYEDFIKYLSNLELGVFIGIFSKLFNEGRNKIFFISKDIHEIFYSNSICFINDISQLNPIFYEELDHKKIADKLKATSHFSGIENCLTLPEDFKFIKIGSAPVELQKQFEYSCLLLSISCIYDFSELKGNNFYIKINGYKTYENQIKLSDLKIENLNKYFRIYKWVLEGGSLHDKIGLARNLISLNINTIDGYTLDDSVFDSIQSGFKVYEKQNIKQYIELRNKMSDQLIGFNEKASKIVENFAISFQKSALAVVSLFASLIISKVLGVRDLNSVFTFDATVISLIFLLISLVYYFVCRWEIKEQKKRYIESYENMKVRNEDLLTKEDIQKVLNNDQEYKTDILYIDEKRKIYSKLWIFVIVILTLTSLFLHIIYRFQNYLW